MSARAPEVMFISPDKNVLEAFLLGLCALSGIIRMFDPILEGVPLVVLLIWNGLLALGGIIGLIGVLWPDPIVGALILRAALVPVGFGAYLYIPASYITGNLIGALIVASFGLCVHLRVFQITRQLRKGKLP